MGKNRKATAKKKQHQDDLQREKEIRRRNEIEELQDQEIELLSSIYIEEFASDDDNTDYDFPKCFKISLLPRTGADDEAHVGVTLYVKIPRDYPHVPAHCQIMNVKGISNVDVRTLETEVENLAREKVGEVCVYELANLVHDFLDSHNEMVADSVHAEMTARKKKERENLQAIEEKKERERQKQEKVLLEQRLAEEMTKRKNRAAKCKNQSLQSNSATNYFSSPAPDYHHDDIFSMDDLEDAHAPEPDEIDMTIKNHSRMNMDFGRGLLDPQTSADESSDESGSDGSWSDEKEEDDFDDDEIDISLDTLGTTPMQKHLSLRSSRSLGQDSNSSKASMSRASTLGKSRYLENFEEICLLGRGGFGEVVKARNKLDGHFYGIKKVKIRSDNVKARMRILREVTTIARLHHKYIVRYFQAWIEGADDSPSAEFASDVTDFSGDDVHDWMQKSSGFAESDEEAFISDFSPVLGAHSILTRSPPKEKKSSKECLYIQFEYCPNQTLRDVIDEGLSHRPDKIWRLFRQILEALEYCDAKGIVHRDIKPPNVFLDEGEDIKIGDFGLATATKSSSSMPNTPGQKANLERSMSTHSVSDVAGTPYYRSPEQELGAVVDHKADMYAVGVVFFEMWTHFNTLMERHEALTELRSTGLVPKSHAKDLSDNVIKVVQWLLKPKAEDRPTAHELLHSGLVPLAEDEQYLREALHALTSANSAFRPRVIDVLFSHEPDLAIDLTYDIKDRDTSLIEIDAMERMRAFDRIEHVFRQHGAVRVKSPLLAPKVTVVRESAPCTLLDPTGTLVQLPHSLTVPFARLVALRDVKSIRRYEISRIFRQSVVGGQPHESLVCGFDIVFPSTLSKKSRVIYQCETIIVVDEIINAISSHMTRYCIYVNHLLLLETLLDVVIPVNRFPKARKAIGAILAQLGRVRWSSVKRTLMVDYHLPEDEVNVIGAYVTLKGTFEATLTKVENVLKAHGLFSSKIKSIVEGFSMLFRLLEAANLSRKVLFHAGLVGDIQLYQGGFVFQVVQEGKGHRRNENIAVGGRYDSLISSFRPPSATTTSSSAVGVSIAIEHILDASQPHSSRKKASSSQTGSNLDDLAVVLFANAGKLLEERLSIASLLWAQGIRAEYTTPDTLHNAATMPKFCRVRHCRWLAVFRPKLFKSGLVRLYDLLLTTQDDIEVHSLVSHIQRASSASEKGTAPAASLGSSNKEPEVEFLHPNESVLRSRQSIQHIRVAQNMAVSLVGGLESNQYALLGVFAPLEVVRQLGSAYYEGGADGMKALVQASHSWRDHMQLLADRIIDIKSRLTTRFIYTYSVEDRRYDLMCL